MKFYTIYKITNNINNKYYIGKHITNNIDDSYMGSGKAIKAAIKKYGRGAFKKEILHVFDNEEDMSVMEKRLVCVCNDSYNLTEGGKGGFGYIQRNRLNHGNCNVMKRPEVVQKNKNSNRVSRNSNKQHYDKVSIHNLEKTWTANKGKKRPEHSERMKELGILKDMWASNREQLRDRLSGSYIVTSPEGDRYETNRLTEFCVCWGISFQTIFSSSARGGVVIKKGAAKGWKCMKI